MRNYPSTLLLPLAALSLASCGNQKKEETKRPNIIFMMTDDHTTQAMSCYGGNLIQTPKTGSAPHRANGKINRRSP